MSPIDPKKIFVTKSKSNVCSRIVRELFHRLLQLYSPIKLKSDGSNASYISILACGCLQELVETQRVLTLEQSKQQSQVCKQSTMKPGVAIHTIIPNIFEQINGILFQMKASC